MENQRGSPSRQYGEISYLQTCPHNDLTQAIVRDQRNYIKYILSQPNVIHTSGPIGMNPVDRARRHVATVGNVDLGNEFIDRGAAKKMVILGLY